MIFDLSEEMLDKILYCLERQINRLEKRVYRNGGNYKTAKGNAQPFIDVRNNLKQQMKNLENK